jgi:uncharacterized protein
MLQEEFTMPFFKHAALSLLLLAFSQTEPLRGAEPEGALHIDAPVQPRDSKIVFDMDHPEFSGDQPKGLTFMKSLLQSYKAGQVPIHIVAVFHEAAAYMVLNDVAYDKARKARRGNPYKDQIKALQDEGVEFELCANTARGNGWVNADLLPGIRVTSGANLRLIQLMQEGYISIRP